MDMDLLEKIYQQYYKKIYNYICFRINNHFDAEELVSTVFEKAMRGWETFRPEQSPLEAWLVGIARNVVTDYLRSKKRKFFLPLEDILSLASPHSSPLEIALQKEEHRELIITTRPTGGLLMGYKPRCYRPAPQGAGFHIVSLNETLVQATLPLPLLLTPQRGIGIT